MDTEHVLINTPANLEATFSIDGTDTDADGAVTVTVTRLSDGTAVVTDGATTHVDPAGSGTYRYTLAAQPALDVLTVTWTGTFDGNEATLTTTAEIVGAHLFSVKQARGWDGGVMGNTTDYPLADILEARAGISDEFEKICGWSFVPRYRQAILAGTGTERLLLPDMRVRRLRSVVEYDTDGTTVLATYSAADLADVDVESFGRLTRRSAGFFTRGAGNVTVGYEVGWDGPPQAITRAALGVLRLTLVRSDVPDRATSFTDDLGRYSFTLPDAERGRHYGVPWIDTALNRHAAVGGGVGSIAVG